MTSNTVTLEAALADLAQEISDRFGYRYATSLLTMLSSCPPEHVVKTLVHTGPTGMFWMLHNAGALELTVEAVAVRSEFRGVIPPSTRRVAKRRLDEHTLPF